ncbi:MAG: DUF6159 family protein [Chloroflexota bacterium]|nr:DUF6159 family protein [Chloroflexota bacterium]
MFERFARSIQLVKASVAVLRSDRQLLLFPLIAFGAMAVVTATFAVPFLLSGAYERTVEGTLDPLAVGLAALFYVVSYTVIFFFNSALVGAAMIRLDGGNPTIRDGFRIASSRLPAIVGYAIIAATVGMVMRWIAERGGIIGQLVAGFAGFAWNIATFLVVPILVVEGVGPIEAVKRSSGLLRKTWGEQIVGNVGISVIFGLLALGIGVVGVVLTVALASIAAPLAILGIGLTVLAVAAVALVGAAVSGIFTASVYRYATRGDGGAMFQSDALAAAFRPRSVR